VEYKIEITEVLQRSILISAEDAKQAMKKAKKMYRECGIVLDSSDCVSTEILLLEE